jgi:hypothetical protein
MLTAAHLTSSLPDSQIDARVCHAARMYIRRTNNFRFVAPGHRLTRIAIQKQLRSRRGRLNELVAFVLKDGRATYRPVGKVSFDDVVALVRAAIAKARSCQAQDILIDTTGLVGFPSPDILERFLAVVDWANEANGGLRMVMVARAELIDPYRFGVVVAANRGLISNIFSDEAKAVAWLDENRNSQP